MNNHSDSTNSSPWNEGTKTKEHKLVQNFWVVQVWGSVSVSQSLISGLVESLLQDMQATSWTCRCQYTATSMRTVSGNVILAPPHEYNLWPTTTKKMQCIIRTATNCLRTIIIYTYIPHSQWTDSCKGKEEISITLWYPKHQWSYFFDASKRGYNLIFMRNTGEHEV